MKRFHILFVDDDPKILAGLRRSLLDMRGQWRMHFEDNAAAALALMDDQPIDVIVTDMRMPGMDGAELLQNVQQNHPDVIRLVLSGYTEKKYLDRAFPPSHQFLSKPCPKELLVSTINDALKSRNFLRGTGLRSLVGNITRLPSLPEIHRQVSRELGRDEPSMDRLGAIVSKDVAITAKLLKLVNSPFFGVPRKVVSPVQAVNLVGINYLQSLIMAFAAFDNCGISIPGYSLHLLMEHSLRTSCAADRIAALEGVSGDEREEYRTAGLLHDVGKLILASNMTREYAQVIETVRRDSRPVQEVEMEVLGATHSEMGAYLLRLWGLPDNVVEATLLHHAPCTLKPEFDPALAVYCANILDREMVVINPGYRKPNLEMEYCQRANLSARLDVWRESVHATCAKVDLDETQDTDC